jgi:hypothetical protein
LVVRVVGQLRQQFREFFAAAVIAERERVFGACDDGVGRVVPIAGVERGGLRAGIVLIGEAVRRSIGATTA